MSKPLLKIRFVMDGKGVGAVIADRPGELTVNFTRDEMGGVQMTDADLKPDVEYQDAVQVVLDMAAKYHQKLTELQTFGQALTIDLHYLHKWLPE